MTSFHLTAAVLGTPDPRGLARFYQRILGRPLQGPALSLRSVGGREVLQLSFQLETDHVPPVWPPVPGTQQMQAHLDIGVDDLAAADAVAIEAGARLLEAHREPHEEVHVYADPAGHPFCLFVRL